MSETNKELTDAQKKIIRDKYIQKTIQKNIDNKRKDTIKKSYVDKKVNEKRQDAAIKHGVIAANSGDKAQIAYQNCFRRWPNFEGTFEKFKSRIEYQFTEGMTWDNYPEWEIDHVFPLSKGGAHNVGNMQPLWKTENKRKYNHVLFD